MINLIVFIKRKFDQIRLDYKFSRMAFAWRKRNRHNKTFAQRYFPIDCVTVGKHSYGLLDVRTFADGLNEKLSIGNYVSIANDVVFVLGGHHQTNTFTTFPLKAFFSRINNDLDSASKGPIIIEDEVWIGIGVIILSGVKIGKGAIVGAGAVVTKDIPPYAIVAGNPAKIMKFRFSEDIIDKLKEVQLANIPENRIIENIELFYQDIKDDNLTLENINKL